MTSLKPPTVFFREQIAGARTATNAAIQNMFDPRMNTVDAPTADDRTFQHPGGIFPTYPIVLAHSKQAIEHLDNALQMADVHEKALGAAKMARQEMLEGIDELKVGGYGATRPRYDSALHWMDIADAMVRLPTGPTGDEARTA